MGLLQGLYVCVCAYEVVQGARLCDVRGGVYMLQPIRKLAVFLSRLLLGTICLCIMPMLLGFQAVSSQLMLSLAISAFFLVILPVSSNIAHSLSAVGCSAVKGKFVSHGLTPQVANLLLFTC